MEKIKELITDFFLNMITGAIENLLGITFNIFDKSIENVQSGIVETPDEFAPEIVNTLRLITETAVMPVAGIILTYVFCYEIYLLVAEKNKGNEFDTASLFYLIFKTSVVIILVTNSFDIALAFIDLGQWMIAKVPVETFALTDSFKITLIDSIEDESDLGMGLSLLVIALLSMIFSFGMAGIIYLVAWSRILTIIIFISIAPLPFATLMNSDWLGSIGQTYIKQLLALMLQGFFMMICLVLYSGVINKASELIGNESSSIYAMIYLLVSMGILTLMLAKSHSTAKSVLGVV